MCFSRGVCRQGARGFRFRPGEAYKSLKNSRLFGHPEDLERVVGWLCRHGHLRPAAELGVHPGPPRREYEVNPGVLSAGRT